MIINSLEKRINTALTNRRLALTNPGCFITFYKRDGDLPHIDIIKKGLRPVPLVYIYEIEGAVHSKSGLQIEPSAGVSAESQECIRGVFRSAINSDAAYLIRTEEASMLAHGPNGTQSIRRPILPAKIRSLITRGHCFDGIRTLLEDRAASVLDWEVAHNAFDSYARALADQGMDSYGLADVARMANQASDRHLRQFSSFATAAAAQGYRGVPPIDNYRSAVMEFFFAH